MKPSTATTNKEKQFSLNDHFNKTQQPEPKDTKNFKDEYQEYKKLQEKLNYLESKIMSIKTNLDNTDQREKDSKMTSPTGQNKLLNTDFQHKTKTYEAKVASH